MFDIQITSLRVNGLGPNGEGCPPGCTVQDAFASAIYGVIPLNAQQVYEDGACAGYYRIVIGSCWGGGMFKSCG